MCRTWATSSPRRGCVALLIIAWGLYGCVLIVTQVLGGISTIGHADALGRIIVMVHKLWARCCHRCTGAVWPSLHRCAQAVWLHCHCQPPWGYSIREVRNGMQEEGGKQCAVPAHNTGVGVGWTALSRGPKCSSPWKPLMSRKAKERHYEQGPNAAHNESHSPTGERGQVSVSKVQMQLSTEASLHRGSWPR